MAFDASVVKCFVNESNQKLINAKIDKIHVLQNIFPLKRVYY